MSSLKILIFGASGMLGSQLFSYLNLHSNHSVWASVRNPEVIKLFPVNWQPLLIPNANVENFNSIAEILAQIQPEIVINCIGIIKQQPGASDPLQTILINSLFPHQLAKSCKKLNCKLIQISTDCVFDGSTGNNNENQLANATELYGRSKFLGEVTYDNNLTLRTSIIGHELKSNLGLLEWFLAQNAPVRGFSRAIFSGVPTYELAQIINNFVLTRPELTGLYHISAAPISKFDLLKLIKNRYQLMTELIEDSTLTIDRSLDSSRFRELTGYKPPPWPLLIEKMYQDYRISPLYQKQLPKGADGND